MNRDLPNDAENDGLKVVESSMMSPEDAVIVQDLDIETPVGLLREIIGKRLQKSDLSKHDIYLQEYLLDPNASLYDQGVQDTGVLELSIQVQTNEECSKLIIVEIDKPASIKTAPKASIVSQTKRKRKYVAKNTEENKDDELRIPGNPTLWTQAQVYRWMVWVVKEFGYDPSIIQDYHIDGVTLCAMSENVCTDRFPFGNLLWSHLELLKKLAEHTGSIATATSVLTPTSNELQTNAASTSEILAVPSGGIGIGVNMQDILKSPSKTSKMLPMLDRHMPGNRTGNNGQIQLWQFLLEMLTDADCRDYIMWNGEDGEFKLRNPQMVAQLWGERKNKPAMNYEKLSRALRYYYDSDIICKVPGKRFVYKFVCNLKELVGFDAAQLNKLVTQCAERRRKASDSRTVDEYLHTPNDGGVTLVVGNP